MMEHFGLVIGKQQPIAWADLVVIKGKNLWNSCSVSVLEVADVQLGCEIRIWQGKIPSQSMAKRREVQRCVELQQRSAKQIYSF